MTNFFQNKYLKYKSKYLNIKYGGTNPVDTNPVDTNPVDTNPVDTRNLFIINEFSGVTENKYNINEFSIETLVNDISIDFYNKNFRLEDEYANIIFDNDKSFEENKATINTFILKSLKSSKPFYILTMIKINLIIYNLSGEPVHKYDINEFSIETLVNDINIDFYNTIFKLKDEDANIIYDDDKSFEENKVIINTFKIQSIKDSKPLYRLTMIKINNLYTDDNNESLYDDQNPIQIPNIITYDNSVLHINITDIPNLQNKYYINLSNYKNSVIKKITTFPALTRNTFLKIILPDNNNINEIGNDFFMFSQKIIELNLNKLIGLKKIGNNFLFDSRIRTIELVDCNDLVEIGKEFLNYCSNVVIIKLPKSIIKIDQKFLFETKIKNLDLKKCNNLDEISDEFLNNCKFIKTVKLPRSIKKIGNRFLSNSGIKTVDLDDCNDLDEIGEDFLKGCENIKLIKSPPSNEELKNKIKRLIQI